MSEELSNNAKNVKVKLISVGIYEGAGLEKVIGSELSAFSEPKFPHGVSVLGNELKSKGAEGEWDDDFYYFIIFDQYQLLDE